MVTHEQAVDLVVPASSTLGRRSQLLSDLESRFSRAGIQRRKRAQHFHSLCWLLAIWSASALRRTFDFLAAALLMVLGGPLLFAILLTAPVSGFEVRSRTRLGRWAIPFSQYEFHFRETGLLSFLKFTQTFASLYNVLRGDMSLVGPRAAAPDETFTDSRMAWRRYNLRPGLLSLWWLRKRANIAYSSEVGLDLEYIEKNSFWGDMGIAVRTLPIAFLGEGSTEATNTVRLLGIQIDNLTMAEASKQITTLTRESEPVQVSFVNADCANIAYRDPQYQTILSKSRLVLADGIGVRLGAKFLRQNIRENINGTDMLPFLCAAAQEAGASLYLLGGRPGIPEATAKWIAERYPRLCIAGIQNGFFSIDEEDTIIDSIAASGASILLVAFGVPLQEKWIDANKDRFGAKVAIGVGGLFDFYSGRIPRAPIWMRELGIEWLYRFWREPRRMARRYFIGNIVFLFHIFLERITLAVSRRRRHVRA